MPTTPLLPLPDGLELTAISKTLEGLLISVASHLPTSACVELHLSLSIAITERLPVLLAPFSRMTARLRRVVQAIGFAFNGQGGARLSSDLGIQVSRPTIHKSLYLIP